MPAPQPGAMQRRHSSASSSDTASDHGMNSRHTSQENVSLIPTRTCKVSTSKPAANPLQFIKVGPCDLYRTAQEQLKKVEEVKKVKQERRDEAEDWQSNLDNWKCSRRKRQEHIIERVVEVKKFELEEFDRNRRRSKTFNEMLEERNSKGRKLSLPVYKDDDNDLSELGLGRSKDKENASQINGEDSVFEEIQEDIGSEAASVQETTNSLKQNGINGHLIEEKVNSNDTEEYTYERAIQSYVNFTESRVRGRSLTPSAGEEKSCNGFSKKPSPPVPAKPRRNSCKIEEKLSELEEIKKKSVSTTDLSNETGRKSISVPKVDILKRRELFEKSVEEEQNTKVNRLSGDFSSSKTIRERLSSLGKQSDDTGSGSLKKLNGLSSEVSVKDRLSSIEKNKSSDNISNTVKVNRIINETRQQSVKDRLSSLQKETPIEKETRNRAPSEISSIKDRLSSLDAACHKEIPRSVVPQQEIIVNKKDEFQEPEKNFKDENFERAFSPEEEIYDNKRQQHYRHRSLDSLDVDSTDGLGNESFERVQSLEDLDFCRNYPASSLSGDTDREDSGINTADVSSSVSQADDCDLHLDDDIKIHHQPPIMEELPKQTAQETNTELNSFIKESETENKQISVSSLSEVEVLTDCKIETVVVESPNCFLKLPLRLELDPLPVILESPSEPCPPFDITEKFNEGIQKEESVCDINNQNSNASFQLLSVESKSDSGNKNIISTVNEDTDISSVDDFKNCNISLVPSSTGVEDSQICNSVSSSSPSNTKDSNLPNALPNSSPHNIVNIAEPCTDDSLCGSPLSISNISMDVTEVCMQDEAACSGAGDNKCKTVIEICHKIDSSELLSPLPTPFISVNTDFNFNAQEQKFEDSLEMSDNSIHAQPDKKDLNSDATFVNEEITKHFQALTVDITKEDVNFLPLTETNVHKSSENVLPVNDEDSSKAETKVYSVAEPNAVYPNNEFNLSGEVVFPLSPTTLEPPKEKPPPPPTETSDDDDGSLTEKSSPLRRLDSTKRIKKEIRQKRSSFLGLNDGLDDDSYLEPELEVRPPPDMTTFLAEERRLEQMMYRQSICSESDSNQESRDSGVELEKHPDDLTWSRLHHSRDNSETFGNTSTTSEEEEIIKKEREIIEILEQEELNRYQTNSQNDQDNIGEKLALRLQELEHEKSHLEWERHEELVRRKTEENARNEHENRIQAREQELRKQEEMLLSEREHLEKEQVLLRQRESIMQQQWSSSMQDISVSQQSSVAQEVHGMPVPNYRHSLISANTHSQADYRQSMPDLATTQPRRPPPPIPPSKPLIIPRNQEKRTSSPQQMSRQTIQALSAAPRSRLISNDNWMQTKRKPKVVQDNNYNYQHWLIQEAEHRRITEQNQRQAPPVRRPVPSQSHSQTGQWPQNGTPQYTNWQPPQQKVTHWASAQEQKQSSQWAAPPQQTQPHQQNVQWTNQQSQAPQRHSPPQQQQWVSSQHHPTTPPRSDKPLPDSIIQTLTQRVQNRINSSDTNNNRKRVEPNPVIESRPQPSSENQEKMLSVSGKKKCSHCGDELGRGAAMIIESLRLFYHINCFKCCVCCVQLGDGLMGTDVRVRNNKLHCHNCYSSDDGVKFSCV